MILSGIQLIEKRKFYIFVTFMTPPTIRILMNFRTNFCCQAEMKLVPASLRSKKDESSLAMKGWQKISYFLFRAKAIFLRNPLYLNQVITL